jgi:hypothetical protein
MIAAAVLLAQYAGTLDVLDTVRIGARVTQPAPIVAINSSGASTQPTQGRDVVSADVSMAITARLQLRDRRWDYVLTYSPTFTAAAVELGFNPQTFHNGVATVAWHDRFLRVTLSEVGSYGQYNSAFLYAQPTAPGQTVVLQSAPVPTTIDFGASNTLASVAFRFERHATLTIAAGYSFAGGLNAVGQAVLPEQYGPRADVSLTYGLSRRDSLVTLVGSYDLTTWGACPGQALASSQQPTAIQYCRERASSLDLRETFRHQLSATASLSLHAALDASIEEGPSVGKELVILPGGGGAFDARFGTKGLSTFTLSASVDPYVDIRTGLVSNRLTATAAVSDRASSSVTLRYSVGVLRSLPFPMSDPYPLTTLNGGVDSRIRLSRQFDVVLGTQALWQYQPGFDPAISTIVSAIGYVGVTARAPTLHF